MIRILLAVLSIGTLGVLIGVGLSAAQDRARLRRWHQWQHAEWEKTLEAIDALKTKEE